MLLNKLHILSPFQGLLLLGYPVPGVTPPSVFFRTFGASLQTAINRNPTAKKARFHSKEKEIPQQGTRLPTARNASSHSKEKEIPQQGTRLPSARKKRSHSKEHVFPPEASGNKAPEVRQNIDGGVNPRGYVINYIKALKGRQNI